MPVVGHNYPRPSKLLWLTEVCYPWVSHPQARSQPARCGGGGSELGWVEHQAHPPPLGHCPRDVINLKNAPTFGHSQAPPLGHCPCDVIHIFQGWNKIAKGWNKIAEGWNKIAKGWNKIAEGWNKIAKGWNKIAKGWNKIAEGWNKIAERWNKIAKGWNKIFGMGNWGGSSDPPDPPPPGYGPAPVSFFYPVDAKRGSFLVGPLNPSG